MSHTNVATSNRLEFPAMIGTYVHVVRDNGQCVESTALAVQPDISNWGKHDEYGNPAPDAQPMITKVVLRPKGKMWIEDFSEYPLLHHPHYPGYDHQAPPAGTWHHAMICFSRAGTDGYGSPSGTPHPLETT